MQVNASNFQQIKEDTCLNNNNKKNQRPNTISSMLCHIEEDNSSILVFENLFPPDWFDSPLNQSGLG